SMSARSIVVTVAGVSRTLAPRREVAVAGASSRVGAAPVTTMVWVLATAAAACELLPACVDVASLCAAANDGDSSVTRTACAAAATGVSARPRRTLENGFICEDSVGPRGNVATWQTWPQGRGV